MSTHLQIVALNKTAFDSEVDTVLLPGADGQLGILPMHAPIVSVLNPGSIVAKFNGQETVFVTSGGFAQVSQDKVTVIVDSAEEA